MGLGRRTSRRIPGPPARPIDDRVRRFVTGLDPIPGATIFNLVWCAYAGRCGMLTVLKTTCILPVCLYHRVIPVAPLPGYRRVAHGRAAWPVSRDASVPRERQTQQGRHQGLEPVRQGHGPCNIARVAQG